MKKFILLILLLFLLLFNGCSVQGKMSPHIFIERLSEHSGAFDFTNSECIKENDDCIYFVKDKTGDEYLFCLSVNESGDVNKIGFSCNNTEKAGNYIVHIRDIISVYSPEENPDDIISYLTENGNLKKGLNFYETQWYSWCSNSDENGMFFSVTNNKFVPKSSVEFSLKPNDKTGF